jgi:hypothetical protein
MRQFKTAIVIAILLLSVGILNSCNDTSTKEKTSTDSTANTKTDSSKMKSDTTPIPDATQGRMDSASHKGDQTPPVH